MTSLTDSNTTKNAGIGPISIQDDENDFAMCTNISSQKINKVLPLPICLTTKETITLPKDLQEIYGDSTVTYNYCMLDVKKNVRVIMV